MAELVWIPGPVPKDAPNGLYWVKFANGRTDYIDFNRLSGQEYRVGGLFIVTHHCPIPEPVDAATVETRQEWRITDMGGWYSPTRHLRKEAELLIDGTTEEEKEKYGITIETREVTTTPWRKA